MKLEGNITPSSARGLAGNFNSISGDFYGVTGEIYDEVVYPADYSFPSQAQSYFVSRLEDLNSDVRAVIKEASPHLNPKDFALVTYAEELIAYFEKPAVGLSESNWEQFILKAERAIENDIKQLKDFAEAGGKSRNQQISALLAILNNFNTYAMNHLWHYVWSAADYGTQDSAVDAEENLRGQAETFISSFVDIMEVQRSNARQLFNDLTKSEFFVALGAIELFIHYLQEVAGDDFTGKQEQLFNNLEKEYKKAKATLEGFLSDSKSVRTKTLLPRQMADVELDYYLQSLGDLAGSLADALVANEEGDLDAYTDILFESMGEFIGDIEEGLGLEVKDMPAFFEKFRALQKFPENMDDIVRELLTLVEDSMREVRSLL